MCIPVALDVPVLTDDDVELGTAREIICPHVGRETASAAVGGPLPIQERAPDADLWLRVERIADADLFIPFSAIAEVCLEGVRLSVSAAESEYRDWDRPPAGVKMPAGSAA